MMFSRWGFLRPNFQLKVIKVAILENSVQEVKFGAQSSRAHSCLVKCTMVANWYWLVGPLPLYQILWPVFLVSRVSKSVCVSCINASHTCPFHFHTCPLCNRAYLFFAILFTLVLQSQAEEALMKGVFFPHDANATAFEIAFMKEVLTTNGHL